MSYSRLSIAPTKQHAELSHATIFFTLAALFVFISWQAFTGAELLAGDADYHFSRIVALANSLKTAEPAYLYPNIAFDYGFPWGVFYPDLFLYPFAWLINLHAVIPLQAFRLYIVCSNVALILVAFFSFRRLFQSNKVALFGCILYAGSIWRFANIAPICGMGEYTAPIFYPLLAVGLHDIRRMQPKSGVLFLVAGFAGLIHCHVINTAIATIFFTLYVLIEFRTFLIKPNILFILSAAVFTALVCAHFVVPLLSWLPLVAADESVGRNYEYAQDILGLAALRYIGIIKAPRGVGIAMVASFMAGVAMVTALLAKRQTKSLRPLVVVLLLSTLSLWLSSKYFPVSFLRENIPLLYSILIAKFQFATRYHNTSILLLTLVAMLVFAQLHAQSAVMLDRACQQRLCKFLVCKLPIVFCVLMLSLSIGQSAYNVHLRTPKSRVPYWTYDWNPPFPPGDILYKLKGTNLLYEKTEKYRAVMPSHAGKVSFSPVVRTGFRFELHAKNTSENPEWLDFPVWNYPGYKAVSSKGEKLDIADGYNRRVRVYLPPGFNDSLTLRWVTPLSWRVAHIVSWVSLVALLLFAFTPLPKRLARLFPRPEGSSPAHLTMP